VSELVAGLAAFGAMFIGTVILLPVFLLQKTIVEGRREKESDEREGRLENQRPL
jgi:hypothetical protein